MGSSEQARSCRGGVAGSVPQERLPGVPAGSQEVTKLCVEGAQ